MAGLIIKPRTRLLHGHDWVYSSDVLKIFGEPADGEVVSLKDGKDRMLGSAIYNSRSQIVARRFSRQRQALDADFFKRRIELALAYRRRQGVDPRLCRLVWSESDGLPGVVVDRYGDCLVLQTLTLAMDQRKETLVEALRETVQPQVIVERNDAPIRRAEGMDAATGVLYGEAAPVEILVDGVRFEIDVLHGQKTGFYLDQMENYRRVAAHASGRRVLDCFSNHGAFALACAKAGAAAVTAVEISAEGAKAIRANAERNGLPLRVVEANVFDFLNAETDARYDLVILDPPSFTKNREKLNDALRGYKEIHLRALKLLSPHGLLATFSCSHHISAPVFAGMLGDALVDAKKSARQIKTFQQGLDHPILVNLPETGYLKGLLVELAEGR